jgi:hypothetical protein
VAKTPLPDRGDDWTIEIHCSDAYPIQSKEIDPFIKESSLSLLPKKMRVPETLDEPHPLILQTANVLESRKPDSTGIVPTPRRGCLDIKVSEASIPRALRIMDVLIKALLSMGHDVSITGDGTSITILDTVVNIRMKEELVRRRLKAKDHNLNGYYQFGYKLFEDKPTPSGNLLLEIIDLRPPWEREVRQRQW